MQLMMVRAIPQVDLFMAGDLTEGVCASIKSREVVKSSHSAEDDEVVKDKSIEGAEVAPEALGWKEEETFAEGSCGAACVILSKARYSKEAALL